MKTAIFIALVVIAVLLAGIFLIELQNRQDHLAAVAAAQEAERVEMLQASNRLAQQLIQANERAVFERRFQLQEICSDFQTQSNLLRNHDYYGPGVTTAMANEIWSNYYSSFVEAQRQLSLSNIDLSVPSPSTDYRDREKELGL